MTSTSITFDDADALIYEETHVHSVYESIASHFSSTRYKPWPVVDTFLRDLVPGSIGLDVGCGNGKYLNVNKDVFIVGSDRSSNLIALAARHQTSQPQPNNGTSNVNPGIDANRTKYNADVLIADTLSLPHSKRTFDFAICIAVIHHLSSRERRIAAIQGILGTLKLDSNQPERSFQQGHPFSRRQTGTAPAHHESLAPRLADSGAHPESGPGPEIRSTENKGRSSATANMLPELAVVDMSPAVVDAKADADATEEAGTYSGTVFEGHFALGSSADVDADVDADADADADPTIQPAKLANKVANQPAPAVRTAYELEHSRDPVVAKQRSGATANPKPKSINGNVTSSVASLQRRVGGRVGRAGQALIFVWALEQQGSRRGWKEGDRQDVLVPWVLKAHGKYSREEKQQTGDAAKKSKAKGTGSGKGGPEAEAEAAVENTRTEGGEKEQVFGRYYHLYAQHELEAECRAAGAKVVRRGYDRDNWWVVIEPVAVA